MASVVHGGGNNGAGGGLVVTELSHIRELVRQLEVHLGGSPDLCKHLAAQISSLTERSIGLVTASQSHHLDAGAGRMKRSAADAGLASPLSSAAATPTSDVTAEGPFKSTKKRKGMEARRHQVRVTSPVAGGDNPAVDDGHSWRKYGQKEILGAKHPRGYYRCTHRHSQGCLATKQVQRSDEDPALFDVIYHGDHTCVHTKAAPAAHATQTPEHNPEAHSILQSLTAGLTVKTEGLPALAGADPQGWSATATPFSFSATPASGLAERSRSPFSTSENWGVSPATSDSNNNHAASYLPFEDAEWRGQAEFQEVVSALVAASAPPPPPPPMDGLDELIASFLA